MNAQERIAKQLAEDDEVIFKDNREIYLEKVEHLLTMKQYCAECDGTGNSPIQHYRAQDFLGKLKLCHKCHGTGESPYPVIAEACQYQTPPDCPNHFVNLSWEYIQAFMAGYEQAQQDMIKEGWVKCVQPHQ